MSLVIMRLYFAFQFGYAKHPSIMLIDTKLRMLAQHGTLNRTETRHETRHIR